jgi:general stress protein 26
LLVPAPFVFARLAPDDAPGSASDFASLAGELRCGMKETKTTASRDPKTFARLQELVRDIDIAMVTTVTPDGALRSRPMATREFNDDGEIWFFTADDSGKASDIASEQAVNVSYAEPKKQRYVSVTGNASLIRDRERAEELWTPVVKAWFPGGLDDPHLALLCVRVETAEYWDTTANKMVQLYEMTKAATSGDDPDLGEHAKIDIRATPTSG